MKTTHTIEFLRYAGAEPAPGGITAAWETVVADVELEIDLAALARALGERAARNGSRKATLGRGLIRARVLDMGVASTASIFRRSLFD